MTKRLLVEYFPISYDPVQLNEAVKNNGLVSFKAILQRANSKNQNGRVYPFEILMRESQKYSTEYVKERRALGELDHPENRTVVNLANVSHNISEMHWEGDDLMGTIEVLNTPSGNIVKELMRNGIKIGVSSRGVGSVRELGENTVEVEDDFGLICFDIVSNPSTQGAFLSEGINNSIRDNKKKRVHALISDFLSEVGN